MPRKSAGLLLYRRLKSKVEVFLVHPGGPYWAKKDDGIWSIPKGEFSEDEEPLTAAQREFKEETGFSITGQFHPLNPVTQPGGKTVYAWAVEGDVDAAAINSNTFSVQWPPGSVKIQQFPEADRADWFTIDVARQKILKGQIGLLDQLESILSN